MSQRKRGVPSQAVDLKRLLSRLGRNLFIAATLLTAFFATSAYAKKLRSTLSVFWSVALAF